MRLGLRTMRDLSLHLLDIVQNSLEAKADNIRIKVSAAPLKDTLEIDVEDNGIGMDQELLSKVTSPFTTTRLTRKTGMGLALLKESAERTGGRLEIESKTGKGTFLKAIFKISNIDRVPLGDLGDTVALLTAMALDTRFTLELTNSKEVFILNTDEVKEKLGGVPLNDYNVTTWLKEYINENTLKIFGGVLDEVAG